MRPNLRSSLPALALVSAFIVHPSTLLAQGSLTPAGAPAPTMKTLAQIEPRIPINATTTPGDTDSLFKIIKPGSYYLTNNLSGVAAKIGLEIASGGVTVDLMGFELTGAASSLQAIYVTVACSDVHIRNGSIRGWASQGVNAFNATNSVLEILTASGNTNDGIRGGPASIIRDCTAANNGDQGIRSEAGSTITGCNAYGNAGTGIIGTSGSVVTHCAANLNGGTGISISSGSTVSCCVARQNTGDGIAAGDNCFIFQNTSTGNGVGAGAGAGVRTGGANNRIEGNNVTGNDRGIDVDAAGNLILRNSARGNITNYEIAADNRYGPIINITAAGTAAVSGSGTAASTLSSSDAWANFSY